MEGEGREAIERKGPVKPKAKHQGNGCAQAAKINSF